MFDSGAVICHKKIFKKALKIGDENHRGFSFSEILSDSPCPKMA